MSRTGSLYICYGSLADPLIHTQVVAYLEGLAASGFEVVLLTFEPGRPGRKRVAARRAELRARGIDWYRLRYHKSPSVPGTLLDIACGIVLGTWLVIRRRLTLIHARSHVPGLMGLGIKLLTGRRLLFDIRGFLAEEYVEAGTWREGGVVFRVMKRVERLLMGHADAFVMLSRPARELLTRWYPEAVAGKRIELIPCCVDLRNSSSEVLPVGREPNRTTFAYVGKLGGKYMQAEMAAFVAAYRAEGHDARWRIWTQSDPVAVRDAAARHGLAGAIDIGFAPPARLQSELASADVGLCFWRPVLSNAAASPTKIGEYLAAGLVVVTTSGLGNTDDVLSGNGDREDGPVGVILHGTEESDYLRAVHELRTLLAEPGIRERCRARARRELSLEEVGWPRYVALYRHLIPADGSP